MHRSQKGRDARQWGYNFEIRTTNLLKAFLKDPHQEHIYNNVKIQTPQSWVEADIIFFWNNTCFILQCKRRKGVSKTGQTNKFWLPKQHCDELWFDGRKATRQYLDNLWQVEANIKHHRVYKAYGEPHIKTILLIDGLLHINNTTDQYAYVRDTYVTTIKDFPNYLKALADIPDLENPSSTGNKGVCPIKEGRGLGGNKQTA